MNNLQLIKDPEEELYYIAYRNHYDDEYELSIISYANTEKEAWRLACEIIGKAFMNCSQTLREFSEKLSGESHLQDDFIIAYNTVPRPLKDNDYDIDGFDALFWNEDFKQWGRLYR